MTRARSLASAGLLAALLAGATTTALAAEGESPGGSIPVLGRANVVVAEEFDRPRATFLVHGVRRIDGGTVLYYSVGVPEGQSMPAPMLLMRYLGDTRFSSSSTLLGSWFLVDGAHRKVYSTLVDKEGGSALASPTEALGSEGGKLYVLYQVLPELPAGVDSVDVLVGHEDVIADVPVEDGALEPATVQTGPILLGEGWPQIDPAAVAAAPDPGKSIHPLQTTTADLEKTVVTREAPAKITVDLAADVLFSVDSARLGTAARKQLQAAAKTINDRGATGAVQIVGHTDSTGTPAHNLDLSKRRAQAVADALKPLVKVSGLSYQVSGKGESEPVASNDTDSGRRDNRRVSITFTPAGGE